jgi:hypothetical protein
MKLCANSTYGPMPANNQQRRYRVIFVPTGQQLCRVFYADDETGEVWRFIEAPSLNGSLLNLKTTRDCRLAVEKLYFGSGMIRIEDNGWQAPTRQLARPTWVPAST